MSLLTAKAMIRLAASIMIVTCLPTHLWPQQYTKFEREQAQQMLKYLDEDVRKYYYDPKLRGNDWDAAIRQAQKDIDSADSMDGAMVAIAKALDDMNGYTGSFSPPSRAYVHRYGFRMRMVGDRCYVSHVRAGGNAEAAGLQRGDQILAINGSTVSRKSFIKIEYLYYALRPQPALRLTLARGDAQQQIDVLAKVEPSPVLQYALHLGINAKVRDWAAWGRILEARYFEKGDDLLVVRIPDIDFSAEEADRIIGRMRKHKGVVMDLRDNGGGYSKPLERLLGSLFQDDVKVYDRVKRTSSKPVVANGRHHDAFTGRLAVLVDSTSIGSSELFARVVQLEKRGFVLGDHTPGLGGETKICLHETLLDSHVYYRVDVPEADLVMTDHKSINNVGVDPDIIVLPTAEDLAVGRDPAMAKAAGLVGVKISPEEAGTMFSELQPLHY